MKPTVMLSIGLAVISFVGIDAYCQGSMGHSWQVSLPEIVFPRVETPYISFPSSPIIGVDSVGRVFLGSWTASSVTGLWDIYVRVRSPSGSWSPRINVTREHRSGPPSYQPRMVVTSDDVVIVAWDGARVSWSSDGGASFSLPIDVSHGLGGREIDVALTSNDEMHVTCRGSEGEGIQDVFYTFAPGPIVGKGGSIDPRRFTPMRNVTEDLELQDSPSIAVNDNRRVFISFVTDYGAGKWEWVELENGQVKRREFLDPPGIVVEMASFQDTTHVVYSRLFGPDDSLRRQPHAFRIQGPDSFPFGKPIPSALPIAHPPLNGGIAVGRTGFLGYVFHACDLIGRGICFNEYIEITASYDGGETFVSPLLLAPFIESTGYRTNYDPVITVDAFDNLHVAYVTHITNLGAHVVYQAVRP